jgi:hypothetical protein
LSFRPGFFLLGVMLSLAGLSILGSILVPRDLTDHFLRFHAKISNEYNFFPTARDIRAILDTGAEDGQAVTVIVGGTSVLQGASQAEPEIWTERLQKLLGPSYRVLNFAQRGGRPNDSGNIAAEMLLKQNKPVLFICDAMPNQVTIPLEFAIFRKPLFDAWQRGELLDWPARDQAMRAALWSSTPELRSAAWEARFDQALNFDGLWSYVAFEIAGTEWNKLSGPDSILPLRLSSDPEATPAWRATHVYPTGEADLQALAIVKRGIFKSANKWQPIRDGIDEQMPVALRAQSLIVVDVNSPHYVNRLESDEHATYLNQISDMAKLLKEMGFDRSMVVAEDFTEADYTDRVHLSVSGGKKLAKRLAPVIVEMARQRGYVP